MSEYAQKVKQYVENVTNRDYWIEITKCCGYSELMMFYRTYTLADFHNAVKHHFGYTNDFTFSLYVIDPSDGERVFIPPETSVTLNHMIRELPAIFKPIYPLPAKVVYRVYLDDGHRHADIEDQSLSDTGL